MFSDNDNHVRGHNGARGNSPDRSRAQNNVRCSGVSNCVHRVRDCKVQSSAPPRDHVLVRLHGDEARESRRGGPQVSARAYGARNTRERPSGDLRRRRWLKPAAAPEIITKFKTSDSV